jgi:hypothetical protein
MNITQRPATETEVKKKGQESLKFVFIVLARLLLLSTVNF